MDTRTPVFFLVGLATAILIACTTSLGTKTNVPPLQDYSSEGLEKQPQIVWTVDQLKARCNEYYPGNEEGVFQCYISMAVEFNETSICMEIPEVDSKEMCIRSVAIHTGNKSLCILSASSEFKQSCESYVADKCLPPPESSPSTNTKEECDKKHGEWGPQGLQQFCQCTTQSALAGKPCTDSKDCLCLVKDPEDFPGHCARSSSMFGCYTYLDKGKPVSICVD